jgi:hypothetical protein
MQIPSDNHVRDMLDPVEPEHFHPLFAHAAEVGIRSNFLELLRAGHSD